ncbi:succinyldiaminopimelate transaminase [Glycomyces harbinensis]|uniref:Succinyldiaminopimelate aminotransferase apoenzyme n=1 Tax=Glycomyces harbinensis TaxID=58114 RepID=A0A1G7D174_9ACTN|nr:succinyldiaminopimelate transaminase [Glycomyces harbinensis]SDE45271.1 succinyldiaminopimelate aminotransferase apoenzyme [Glycomyces harbinensis]
MALRRLHSASPARRLPRFPWDRMAPFKERAAAHPGGLVDLTVGAPVDEVPEVVRQALAEAAARPGYPTVAGPEPLREAMRSWLHRHTGVADDVAVLPTVGSKELVANLPFQLGVGPGDAVAYPEIAYPTYEIGAILAKAQALPVADPRDAAGSRLRLAWINYPTNPTGEVASVEHLRGLVRWARDGGVVLASDECYLTLGWDEEHPPVSVLDPRVNDGDLTGLLAAHSLSKRSNLAGYRSAFLAGDPELIADLLEIRRHAGFMVPWPVQQATIAALHDESHAIEQRARYERRRDVLRGAVEAAGFRIDHSAAGLYLWATRDEPCWDTVSWLAERGILAAAGEFYGAKGNRHVRLSLTATDEALAEAAQRLK